MPSERRVHAGWNADDQREKRRGAGKLQRRRKALLQKRRHRAALAQREPELAAYGTRDEAAELNVERLIESEIRTQPGAVLLRGVLSDHERHRIAREIEQAEG